MKNHRTGFLLTALLPSGLPCMPEVNCAYQWIAINTSEDGSVFKVFCFTPCTDVKKKTKVWLSFFLSMVSN